MRLLGRFVPVPVLLAVFLALCLLAALLSRPLTSAPADADAGRDRHARHDQSDRKRHGKGPAERRGSARPPVPADARWSGFAFDACRAPSQAVMDRWRTASPFTGVGIYLGGVHRACEQRHLTPRWVTSQTRAGWKLLPIWVGPQASCTGYDHRIVGAPGPRGRHGAARADGRYQASRAAATARSLRLPPGHVIFYDLEPFDTGRLWCRGSSLAFLEEWTKELHRRGYRSGVYSHVNAGISLLSRTGPAYVRPDAVWYAWIDRVGSMPGEYVADDGFMRTSRVHQYALDTRVEFGGIPMAIDWNYVTLGAPAVPAVPPASCDRVAERVEPATVRPGARGTIVRAVQCLVSATDRHPSKTSGRYDAATVRAVRSFQQRRGLPASGVVDRRTWTSLLARGWTPYLKKGADGESVRRLQRGLNAALPHSEVAVDGSFGPETTRAVRRYRGHLGLETEKPVVTDRVWGALARGRVLPSAQSR